MGSPRTKRSGCELHVYVLMTNHVRLLVTAKTQQSNTLAMQHVGRRYVPYINRKCGGSGTLWEGRFTETSLGSEGFKADVEAKLNLKVGQNRRGRPNKPADQYSEND